MSKLIVVIGLPGSGKSHYLAKLKADKAIAGYYDDYQKNAYGKNKDPRFSRHYGPLLAQLKKQKTMAVADILYCKEPELDAFLQSIVTVLPETEIELHYFENEPNAAIKNIHIRAREQYKDQEIDYVRSVSPTYKVPKIKTIPIYK